MINAEKMDWDAIPKAFGGFVKMINGEEIIIQFMDNDISSSPGYKNEGESYQFNVIFENEEKILSTGSLKLINKFKVMLPLKGKNIGITMHELDGYRDYDIRRI